MQFESINKTINNKFKREAQQEHYYINNNAMEIILELDNFIKPKKCHQY